MGLFHKIKKSISKITKPVTGVVGAAVGAVTGQTASSQAVDTAPEQDTAAVANTVADNDDADTQTNDSTNSTQKKNLAKGKTSLTIARSGGSGLNI